MIATEATVTEKGTALSESLSEMLVELYCRAAREGADMRVAATALENLRDQTRRQEPLVKVMADLDDEIGRADPALLAPLLKQARDRYFDLAGQEELARLRDQMRKAPDDAWAIWARAYADTFHERNWALDLGLLLADQGLPPSLPPDWPTERIRQAARFMRFTMWPDVYDWFGFLAAQKALAAKKRAELLLIMAQIQLYHFVQPTRALKLIKEAEGLSADAYYLNLVWGDYYLRIGDLAQARERYASAIAHRPDLSTGYFFLGRYYEQAGQLEDARFQYKTGIATTPGNLDCYEGLLDWYGRPEAAARWRDELESTFQRLLILTTFPPDPWVRRGALFRQERDYLEARRCFETAWAGQPDYMNSVAWLGHVCLDEAVAAANDGRDPQPFYDQAARYFDLVIAELPTALDGYYGHVMLHVWQGDWAAALGAIDRCDANTSPEWDNLLLVERADVLQRLGRLAEAEEAIARSLKAEPKNRRALDVLLNLADAYNSRSDVEGEKRLLRTLARHKAIGYEHQAYNRMGHLYYRQADYEEAARHYRKATAVKPDDPVLWSNNALALEMSSASNRRPQHLKEAIKSLERAVELDPADESYPHRLEALKKRKRLLAVYGENVMQMIPSPIPITIWVDEGMEPDILDESFTTLSSQSLQEIDELHTDIERRMGVIIPGLSYRGSGQPGTTFKIALFRDTSVIEDTVRPGMVFALDPQPGYPYPVGQWIDKSDAESGESGREILTLNEYILGYLRYALEVASYKTISGLTEPNPETGLAMLLGFQETVHLLNRQEHEFCREIVHNTQAVIHFMLVFKLLLSRGVSLVGIDEHCRTFEEQRIDGHSPATIVARFVEAKASGKEPG
jgi:tetratricopeptide (TPR) repeat protein